MTTLTVSQWPLEMLFLRGRIAGRAEDGELYNVFEIAVALDERHYPLVVNGVRLSRERVLEACFHLLDFPTIAELPLRLLDAAGRARLRLLLVDAGFDAAVIDRAYAYRWAG